MKGFIAIVLGNIMPKFGTVVYNWLEDFRTCCIFWIIFNTIVSAIFYVTFYIWKYSDNT